MKKINPKDFEVNPKEAGGVSNNNISSQGERATTVCTDDNYGCTDTGDIVTLAIDCTVDTNQSRCKCPTVKDCPNTANDCINTVSKGEVCCGPITNTPECNYSLRCESKEYCPLTEQDNCNSDGIQCVDPKTYACQLYTEGACGERTFNCDPETGEKCQNTEQGAGCNLMSDDPGECTMISADCVD